MGKFANGSITGAFVMMFNELAHEEKKENLFFEKFRKHYDSGSGDDIVLTKQELEYMLSQEGVIFHSERQIMDNLYAASVSFYGTSFDLAYTFGTSTVYYYKGENNIYIYIYISFKDTYDFDAKPWGERPYIAEILTRFYDLITPYGKGFHMYYNKPKYNQLNKLKNENKKD